jgi:hypothetical protein
LTDLGVDRELDRRLIADLMEGRFDMMSTNCGTKLGTLSSSRQARRVS